MDNTTLHPTAEHRAHRVDLHMWRGTPENQDPDRPIEVMINDGFIVGFSPTRLQPAWVAYRVADGENQQRFDRPLMYQDDMRLPEAHRIGRSTFGKLGGTQLHVGHMAPNAVITRQYGRAGQLETFLMSNMSPQYGSLNQGVWADLEDAIRDIDDDPERDNVWVVVGPAFAEHPSSIDRGDGKQLPVPEKYFCVVVDPHSYPFDTPSKVNFDCFLIPQSASADSRPEDYVVELADIEEATGLDFFTKWGRELALDGPVSSVAMCDDPDDERRPVSRIVASLEAQRSEQEAARQEAKDAIAAAAAEQPDPISALIEELKAEEAAILVQGRPLTFSEVVRLQMIQHTIAALIRIRDELAAIPPDPDATPPIPPVPPEPSRLVTYNVVDDRDDKLKRAA